MPRARGFPSPRQRVAVRCCWARPAPVRLGRPGREAPREPPFPKPARGAAARGNPVAASRLRPGGGGPPARAAGQRAPGMRGPRAGAAGRWPAPSAAAPAPGAGGRVAEARSPAAGTGASRSAVPRRPEADRSSAGRPGRGRGAPAARGSLPAGRPRQAARTGYGSCRGPAATAVRAGRGGARPREECGRARWGRQEWRTGPAAPAAVAAHSRPEVLGGGAARPARAARRGHWAHRGPAGGLRARSGAGIPGAGRAGRRNHRSPGPRRRQVRRCSGQCAASRRSGRAGPPVGPTAGPALA
jgi:hypothetical protein